MPYAALIAEATNLGFSKMAHACPGITRRQLQQMAIWHFREETFALALAKLVEAQHSAPFSTVFGSHTISSSDGQHIHLGDGGEVAGGVNQVWKQSDYQTLHRDLWSLRALSYKNHSRNG